MAEIIYDLVLPSLLTGFVRETPVPSQIRLNQFLPDREIDDIEAMWDQVTRTNRAAKFRAYDAETPIGKRDQFQRSRVLLPPIGEKRVVGEYERLQLERLRGGGNPDRLVAQIFDDQATNVRAVRNRMELARGDVLTDGKFTLTGENGLFLEADFGVPGGNLVAPAGALWSDHANAVPLTDLQTWIAAYTDLVGEPPAYMQGSRAIQADLLANQEIRQIAGSTLGTPSSVSRTQLNQILDDRLLPQLLAPYDTLIDVDGVSTRPIASTKLLLLPQNPSDLGYTAWGITAESLELASLDPQNGGISLRDAPGIVGLVMKDGDPVRTWSKVAAVGMPILTDPRRLMVATVR